MRKWIIAILIGIGGVIVLIWAGGRWLFSLSVADYQGNIILEELREPVEITFDARGIPQIWAENELDMYFTLGWTHASERLFQMELARRLSAGKLAELFGEAAYPVDVFQRKIGFLQQAREALCSIHPQIQQYLQAYCAGINAWIHYKQILPPEFLLLRFRPESWQPEDCLALMAYQTWFSHELADRDEAYQCLIEKLGDDVFKLLNTPKKWSPSTIRAGILTRLFQKQYFPLRMTRASNSWVVSPQKSLSGAAIHASDPHLPVNTIPGFWYVVGLHTPETNVLGVTVPGLPFVAMGHNGHAAYAFTVASLDIFDFYDYQRDPGEQGRILTENGYQAVMVRHEMIKVRGETQPRRLPVYLTPRGPVVAEDSTKMTVLKWAGHDFGVAEILRNAFKLHQVKNYQDFRKIVNQLGALDVNWTYSDIQGNIGYVLGAPVPIRRFQNTYIKWPGEDRLTCWQGYVAPENKPYLENPSHGWLANCNNRVVPEAWPDALPGFYSPYRMERITALLNEERKFSREDFYKMQLDSVSVLALRWKHLLEAGARKLDNVSLAEQIRQWKGVMSAEKSIPALFALWWQEITRILFEDELEDDWENARFIQEEVLTENVIGLVDDNRTKTRVEDRVDIAAEALKQVLKTFKWKRYGEIHQLWMKHPLSQIAILDYWLNLNRGPVPMSGDKSTLNAVVSAFQESEGVFYCHSAPSMRFVLDWSDMNGFTINTNLGQSGNPLSPHYDDFKEIMQKGARWRVPFDKEEVYKNQKSLLVLRPGRAEGKPDIKTPDDPGKHLAK